MYQHWPGAALFAERAVETAHSEYVTLTGLGTFARAPEDKVQSLDYSGALP